MLYVGRFSPGGQFPYRSYSMHHLHANCKRNTQEEQDFCLSLRAQDKTGLIRRGRAEDFTGKYSFSHLLVVLFPKV